MEESLVRSTGGECYGDKVTERASFKWVNALCPRSLTSDRYLMGEAWRCDRRVPSVVQSPNASHWFCSDDNFPFREVFGLITGHALDTPGGIHSALEVHPLAVGLVACPCGELPQSVEHPFLDCPIHETARHTSARLTGFGPPSEKQGSGNHFCADGGLECGGVTGSDNHRIVVAPVVSLLLSKMISFRVPSSDSVSHFITTNG